MAYRVGRRSQESHLSSRAERRFPRRWRCVFVLFSHSFSSAHPSLTPSLPLVRPPLAPPCVLSSASHLLQVAAIPLLSPSVVRTNRLALQHHFKWKRDHVLSRLEAMGFEIANKPTSTFYIWLPLKSLPAPLSTGLVFFEECLKEKVIVVPGQFFDLSTSFVASLAIQEARSDLVLLGCRSFAPVRLLPPLLPFPLLC
jgi:hypothetical protein